eukprot:3354666-Pyramimonas_sp.AAC.2
MRRATNQGEGGVVAEEFFRSPPCANLWHVPGDLVAVFVAGARMSAVAGTGPAALGGETKTPHPEKTK